MNQDAHMTDIDGYSQATAMARFNVTSEIKRIHVDAIATNNLGKDVDSYHAIESHFANWSASGDHQGVLGELSQEQLRSFVTSPIAEGGLGLSPGYYEDAYGFSALKYGIGHNNDWGFFLGD